MADADDLYILLIAAEKLTHGLGLRLYGAGGRLLHKDVAAAAVFKREQHQIHSLVERHDEARHRRLRHGYRLALLELVYPQRDDAAARAHDVAVARAADLRAFRRDGARLRHNDLFHHGLAGAHGVYGIGGLIGGKAYCGLHALVYRGGEHVVRAEHVGLYGLQREKLA